MPKPRSPNREKAFEIFKEHNGEISNRKIAQLLNISEKSISGWKSKENWNGVLQTNKRSTPKARGAPLGNKNAVGNHGGGAPEGNKNAVGHGAPKHNKNSLKTGEFERILFDTLDEEEQRLIQCMEIEKINLLKQEIQLLTVRERRMLRRISDLKEINMTVVSIKTGIEKGKQTNLEEEQGTLGQIQRIEDALTRVQEKKQKAIDLLHKFEIDESKLEVELMRIEISAIKDTAQEQTTGDDGFLSALEGQVEEVWGEKSD